MDLEKIVSLTLISVILAMVGFMISEPRNIQAASDTVGVSQTVIAEINISCSSTASLPSVNGQTGGTATTSFGCTVESNSASGWTLDLKYDHKLNTEGGGADKEFDEYTTSSSPADYDWDSVGSGNEEFGFNVNSGPDVGDVVAKFKDDGASSCGGAANQVNSWHCFYPISTTNVTVLDSSEPSDTGGENYDIGLRDEIGSGNNLQSGTYNCTITATATNQ